MQYQSYYQNFFLALAASLSDDAFMAFVEQTYRNLAADPARAAEAALLQPLYNAQRQARQAAGSGGQSGKVATLGTTIREFLAWVRLTNATTVFAKFPNPGAEERLTILPHGATGLYDADHGELLTEATTYVDGLKLYQDTLGKTAGEEGDAWLLKLSNALSGRGTEVKTGKVASSALDTAEHATCVVLFRLHGRLLDAFAATPAQAAAFFPYPDSDHPAAVAPATPA
ncbi:hypothetical protein [Hymenobacter terricola]|uniref:hypothetical protein n=1 Tax=Hymenobacter terricola TaxID=2819236 RepID=UPI001B3118EA|nr:hypothetical protein [Hymenobacter terricola]